MPADRPLPGGLRDRRDSTGDGLALGRLPHSGVALPTPPMRRDFVPARNRIAGKLGRPLDRASAGTDRRFDIVGVEQVHDTPPRRARAVFEMALDARVRPFEPMRRLVDAFIDRVAIRDGELPALLE